MRPFPSCYSNLPNLSPSLLAGFKESDIGFALSLNGLLSVALQVLFFPPLQKRFGTVRLYRTFMSLWPIVFALFPVMGWCAREKGRREVWAVMVVMLALKSMCVSLPLSPSSSDGFVG